MKKRLFFLFLVITWVSLLIDSVEPFPAKDTQGIQVIYLSIHRKKLSYTLIYLINIYEIFVLILQAKLDWIMRTIKIRFPAGAKQMSLVWMNWWWYLGQSFQVQEPKERQVIFLNFENKFFLETNYFSRCIIL